MTKDLITITEFCEATGLGRTNVYAMLKKGNLAAVKVGRRTLLRREDVDAWKSELKPYKRKLELPETLIRFKGEGNE